MKEFRIEAKGLSDLSSNELKILGGNVCGTLGPEGSDPSVIINAVKDAVKDVYDWAKGVYDGLRGK